MEWMARNSGNQSVPEWSGPAGSSVDSKMTLLGTSTAYSESNTKTPSSAKGALYDGCERRSPGGSTSGHGVRS